MKPRPGPRPAGPRPGPQGQGPGAASAGAQRRRQPAEYRFRWDLYSQESTFPLVIVFIAYICVVYHVSKHLTHESTNRNGEKTLFQIFLLNLVLPSF